MEYLTNTEGYSFGGYPYDEPSQRFVDVNGREVVIYEHSLWMPEFHRNAKLKYVRDVITWWVTNRDKLKNELDGSQYRHFHMQVSTYFGYGDVSGTVADIRKSIDYAKPLMRPSFSFYVKGNSGAEGPHLLLENDGESSTPRILKFYNCDCFGISTWKAVEESSVISSDIRWGKLWNYTYKMDSFEYKFFRKIAYEDAPMLGVELEFSTRLSTFEMQKIVTEVEPKQEPFFIFKHDGTVTGKYTNKVELVTVPCTGRYLRKNLKLFFGKLEKLIQAKGHVLEDYFDLSANLNNGIHTHIDKTSFRTMTNQRKFLTIFNQYDSSALSFINKIAKRPRGLSESQYCRNSLAYDGRTLARRLSGRGLSTLDRYSACHGRNRETLEVRAYQGIFNLRHLLQCISFTEAMWQYSHEAPNTGYDYRFENTVSSFLLKYKKYSSLWEFTKKCA